MPAILTEIHPEDSYIYLFWKIYYKYPLRIYNFFPRFFVFPSCYTLLAILWSGCTQPLIFCSSKQLNVGEKHTARDVNVIKNCEQPWPPFTAYILQPCTLLSTVTYILLLNLISDWPHLHSFLLKGQLPHSSPWKWKPLANTPSASAMKFVPVLLFPSVPIAEESIRLSHAR